MRHAQSAGSTATLGIIIALFFWLVFGLAPSANASVETALTSDPYVIFGRAEAVWHAQRYPKILNYFVHVQAERNGKAEDRHYRSRWFAATGNVVVDPVSIEEHQNPYVPPPGFDISFFGLHLGHVGGPSEGEGTHGDLIGVPILAPNYSFGIAKYSPPQPLTPPELVTEIRAEFHDPAPEKVAQLEREYPKTIAEVLVPSLAYIISLVGTEAIDQHQDYHLLLTPVRDPTKYRLRDIWINSATYYTDQVRTAGNFVDRSTKRVPWLITFRQLGSLSYIKREVSEAPLRNWFESVAISFDEIDSGKGDFDAGYPSNTSIIEPH